MQKCHGLKSLCFIWPRYHVIIARHFNLNEASLKLEWSFCFRHNRRKLCPLPIFFYFILFLMHFVIDSCSACLCSQSGALIFWGLFSGSTCCLISILIFFLYFLDPFNTWVVVRGKKDKDRLTNRQADSQTDRQTDRQTGR